MREEVAVRRELEDAPRAGRGPGLPQGLSRTSPRRGGPGGLVLSPGRFDRSCGPGNRRPPGPGRRGAERVLGAEGGLHRGDLGSSRRGGGSPRRAGRALGTPPPVRRNRRGHRAEAVRRARGAAAPTVVRRGDAGGTGGRKYAGRRDATTGSRYGPPATGRHSTGDRRVRASLGARYRALSHATVAGR